MNYRVGRTDLHNANRRLVPDQLLRLLAAAVNRRPFANAGAPDKLLIFTYPCCWVLAAGFLQ